jgi:hypothetical protein
VQDALSCLETLVDARCTSESELHASLLVVLLLHRFINFLVNPVLTLRSLLLLAALGLLLQDDLIVIIVNNSSSSSRLTLATLPGRASVGVSRLTLLQHVSVNVRTCEIAQTYLGRGHFGVDVFTGSLTCLLDFLLLLVEHDLACLDGAAFR